MIWASASRACALLLGLGVALGTLTDATPARQPMRAGDYWILSGDLHVHAFPGDGALSPWILRDEAARAGLDVIAVTNHNQVFTGRLARWLSNRSAGPMMIVGQEITNRDYHMIAVGVNQAVNADQPVAAAGADVHAQRGVAIAAHPFRSFHGYDLDEAVATLDGTEAAHPATDADPKFGPELTAFHQRARRLKTSVAAIGSSDFHGTPPELGRCRTYLFVRERSEAGVLEAIHSGRTLAVNGDGNLQGDATLIALLGDARPAGRTDSHPGSRRLSVTLAWIGLLGIVLFPHRPGPGRA